LSTSFVRTIFFSACAILTITTQARAQSTADEHAIRATIAEYFRGHATQDSIVVRRPFLPTAHIEGLRQGVFTSWTLDQYTALWRGTPSADEARRRRTIDEISISGTAASAKATLDHIGTVFTDFFVLLKVNGEWKIANKVYYAETRTP
jgi:Putative lumazine-binding